MKKLCSRYFVLLLLMLVAQVSFAQLSRNWEEQYPELALENTNKWVLKSASNIPTLSRVMEVGVDLERKSIVGYGGCNPFQINLFGVNKKKDSYVLSTTRSVVTENLCTDNINDNERQFISNLNYDRLIVKFANDQMTITNKRKVVMTFDKVKANPLFHFMEKYYWKLIQFEGDSSVVYQSYFRFDFANHKLVGDAGCGPFEINFEVSSSEDELSFSEARYTDLGCIDEVRAKRSQAFITKLNNADFTFDVADQTLNFYQNNKLVMMFGFIPKGY